MPAAVLRAVRVLPGPPRPGDDWGRRPAQPFPGRDELLGTPAGAREVFEIRHLAASEMRWHRDGGPGELAIVAPWIRTILAWYGERRGDVVAFDYVARGAPLRWSRAYALQPDMDRLLLGPTVNCVADGFFELPGGWDGAVVFALGRDKVWVVPYLRAPPAASAPPQPTSADVDAVVRHAWELACAFANGHRGGAHVDVSAWHDFYNALGVFALKNERSRPIGSEHPLAYRSAPPH